MVKEIKLPKLGESLTEAFIVKWLKQPGDFVRYDEPLLYITTDKVETEIPSPVEGILKAIKAPADSKVEVGGVLAQIEEASEDEAATLAEREPSTGESPCLALEPGYVSTPASSGWPKHNQRAQNRFYSPLVLKMAQNYNLPVADLENINGTGTRGRVTKKDLENYLQTKVSSKPSGLGMHFSGDRVAIPMDNVRQGIAEVMLKSKTTIPHAYVMSDCDCGRIISLLSKHKNGFQELYNVKLSLNTLFLYATLKALREYSVVNAEAGDKTIIQKNYINLGFALVHDDKLFVPVIKNAHNMDFKKLSFKTDELIQAARKNSFKAEHVGNSSFTVSNFGVFGNILGIPVINLGNSAILGIGAIQKRPVVVESSQGDSLAIRPMTYLTLSFDHRIIDGHVAGPFLERVVAEIENFSEENLL